VTGPEGPELEGYQVEKKSKAAQTKTKKLIRRTCPSGHGSDGSGPTMSTATGAVFLPQSLADTGVLPLISASFWTSSLGNGSQTHGILQHWLFGSQSLVQTEACTQMGSRNCSGMGDSSSGSPEGLRCSPFLCGRKLFF